MNKKTNTIKYKNLVSKAVSCISNERTREIINARFGLLDGHRQTLEAIGQNYGITRERVRQIIDAVLADFKKSDLMNLFETAFDNIDTYFNTQGNLVREERLLGDLTGIDQVHPERGALFFVLTLGSKYQRFVESNRFYPLWINSKDGFKKAERLISTIIWDLENRQEPVSFKDILSYTRKARGNINETTLASYLDAAKQISQSNSGLYGLNRWPEINPRGVKDKAYIVFRAKNQPLHFRAVADLINEANLGGRLAQAQTVHNELIKDGRFVLVGRGTYALKEWGYQPGTVKDVIISVLKNETKPLTKEEILNKVLKSRLVKKNTVLINLQNRNFFTKTSDGKYILK